MIEPATEGESEFSKVPLGLAEDILFALKPWTGHFMDISYCGAKGMIWTF